MGVDARTQETVSGDMTDELWEILEHYGVLGMKWGIRKERRKGGDSKRSNASSGKAPTPVKKTPAASDAAKVQMGEKYKTVEGLNEKQKSKAGRSGLSSNDLSLKQLKETAERLRLENEINGLLDTMTDRDRAMQAAVNRIKLEEEYRRLTAAPPTKQARHHRTLFEHLGTFTPQDAITILVPGCGAGPPRERERQPEESLQVA